MLFSEGLVCLGYQLRVRAKQTLSVPFFTRVCHLCEVMSREVSLKFSLRFSPFFSGGSVCVFAFFGV